MTIVANTFTSFDAKGIREDLSNVIYNIAPEETPLQSNISQQEVSNTLYEWQTDTLAAADATNQHIDGDDIAAFTAVAPTARVHNYTNISRKTFIIADNLRFQDLAGRNSEIAYQVVKNGKELRRDMEAILCANTIPTAGGAAAARKTGGLSAWLSTNSVSNSGGGVAGANPVLTAGIPTTAQTEGTKRAFTETLLKEVIENVWTSGGQPTMVMVGASNKQTLSSFTGIAANRFQITKPEQGTIIGAADIYVSDFGELSIVPNRFQPKRDAYVLDTEYLGVGMLRPMQTVDLAKTGDAEKRMILAEYGLIVKNEAASGAVYDLTHT
jgi:hypothetical protein